MGKKPSTQTFIWGQKGEYSSHARPTVQQTQSLREPQSKLEPSLYKSSQARQKNIINLFSKEKIKEGMAKLISKFFIFENLPANKAASHHFKNLVVGC